MRVFLCTLITAESVGQTGRLTASLSVCPTVKRIVRASLSRRGFDVPVIDPDVTMNLTVRFAGQ